MCVIGSVGENVCISLPSLLDVGRCCLPYCWGSQVKMSPKLPWPSPQASVGPGPFSETFLPVIEWAEPESCLLGC